MYYLLLGFFLHLAIFAQTTPGYAGVAEASTIPEHLYSQRYDLSGLSEKERGWFLTFIRGNIFAEGWGEITNNILRHTSATEREKQQQLLDQLGSKIGREWCKDNDIRRIDSSMLRQWGDKLRKAANEEPQQLPEVISSIDGEVNSLLY